MRKITVEFKGKVIILVEDNEETSDVLSELEITHPDNTRVVDYTIEDWEITDSK